VVEYEKFKLQNGSTSNPKRAFIIFRIKEEKIQLAEQGASESSWQDFLNTLTSNPYVGVPRSFLRRH